MGFEPTIRDKTYNGLAILYSQSRCALAKLAGFRLSMSQGARHSHPVGSRRVLTLPVAIWVASTD